MFSLCIYRAVLDLSKFGYFVNILFKECIVIFRTYKMINQQLYIYGLTTTYVRTILCGIFCRWRSFAPRAAAWWETTTLSRASTSALSPTFSVPYALTASTYCTG